MSIQKLNRLKAEVSMLTKSPPPGIICWQDDENSEIIMAEMTGPPNSPFEKGTFQIEVSLSDRYPFTPPNARFITPIYHPNVDLTGRICLSGLKSKPSGSWNCSMNIAVILSAIRLLMSEPNLADPLVPEIASEYQDNFETFRSNAEKHTLQHAMKKKSITEGGDSGNNNKNKESSTDSTEKSTNNSSPKEQRNTVDDDNISKDMNPPKKMKLLLD